MSPKTLVLALLGLLALSCTKREAHPPIVIISIDTLRSDHLPLYGYRAIATPHIDALGRDSLVYRDAWSHVPLTLPSHLSIFTGLLPPSHGVRDNVGYRFDAKSHPTLAALLHDGGYRSGAAVSAYVLRRESGAAAGFDDYDDDIGLIDGAPEGSLQRSGSVSESIAEKWIETHDNAPFFYFLHLYEPHTPYEPSYDGEIVKSDAIVGKLIDLLKKRGLYDRALIVLLSDHGEGLMDHGEQEHGVLVYREDLRVPLLVKLPHASRRGFIDARAQLIDVAPTVLDVAGLAPPKAMQGVSLLDDIKPRDLYAESLYARIHLGWSELRSIVRGPLQMIDAPHGEVYDLAHDPGERTNIIDRERRTYSQLQASLPSYGGVFSAPDAVDPEQKKKLAALGYVSAGSDAGSGPLPDPKEHIAELTRLKALATLPPDRAIAEMRQLLAANPRWSDIRETLADALDREGDHLGAAHVSEDGILATPRLANDFALDAAMSLLLAHRPDDAARHAQLAMAGGLEEAHLVLGEIALSRGDLATAAHEAELARTSTSQRAHAGFIQVRVAVAHHDYDEALRLLSEIEEERRTSGESLPEHFHYVGGDVLAHVGRIAEAQREFASEIREYPQHVQAYSDLALTQVMTGHREDARATLESMLVSNPSAESAQFAANDLEKWGDREGAAKFRARARVRR